LPPSLGVRLAILGEGKLRAELERLAGQLGIARRVALLGFRENPYAFMAKADLFVLSSEREGNPNVLVEALAVGTPAVATDCPSGPREILAGGRYGTLVPMDDEQALAEAILATLQNPPPAELLREAVRDFTLERSSAAYLKAFGLTR
ncbi:MAG: glycosyltransferase, partial [Candidatus Competibacteraceae bacterium]|nr:glycosyltransferase [Candidatus Competibacteraceae bacterium]